MARGRARKGEYALGRRFGGEIYSIYPLQRYYKKSTANRDAARLREQGYKVRIVQRVDHYLIYFKKS